MAVTPDEEISEGRVFSVFSQTTADLQLSEGRVFAVYNIPTETEEISQAYIFAVTTLTGVQQNSASRVFAVVNGRIDNYLLRAWTFTLDGHDFYVLRLGDETTLIYDVASEQWIEWTSPDLPFWRPNTGMTWIGGTGLGYTYGSSVVVGDDTFGLLWFLDPEQPYDDNPDADRAPQQLPFDRIITGQTLVTGRNFVPCYAIFLDGDNYGLSGVDFTPTIQLETSDDQGRTFDDQGTLTVPADFQQNNPYEWLSLGQISSPGRMFRVTDNGVYARIDTMEMNDDAG